MNKLMLRSFLGVEKRIDLYRIMLSLLRKGQDVDSILQILHNIETDHGASPRKGLGPAIEQWRRGLIRGLPLADAMEGWLPEAEASIIAAGDSSGDLSSGLRYAIRVARNRSRVVKAIRGQVPKPILFIGIALGMLYFEATSLIPGFLRIIPQRQWPEPAVWANTIANGFLTALPWITLVLVLMIGAIAWSLPRLTGKLRVKLDGFGPWALYRLNAGAQFLLSYAALAASGVNERDILDHQARKASPYLKERLSGFRSLYMQGRQKTLGDVLHASGYRFPEPRIISILQGLGSNVLDQDDETGDPIILTLTEEWIEASESIIARQLVLFNALGMAFLAGVILMFVGTMGSVLMVVFDNLR